MFETRELKKAIEGGVETSTPLKMMFGNILSTTVALTILVLIVVNFMAKKSGFKKFIYLSLVIFACLFMYTKYQRNIYETNREKTFSDTLDRYGRRFNINVASANQSEDQPQFNNFNQHITTNPTHNQQLINNNQQITDISPHYTNNASNIMQANNTPNNIYLNHMNNNLNEY